MSVSLQFKCLTHNETAKKAIESYGEILQKAFQRYQDLWENYIKLQEKCNEHSLSQDDLTIDRKIKDEAIFQHFINTNVQESNSTPLMESDTLNTNCINFNFNTKTDPSDASESLYKDTDGNNLVSPPASPVFFKTFLKTGSNAAKKLMRSSKAVGNSTPTSDMKPHHSNEKVPSKYNHKLEISTTHHVETTFLPSGKRLKQSQLVFQPVKNNEKMVVSSSVDKYKPTSIIHNVQQNFIQDISMADVTVTENDALNNTSEISEDVIEISPTQKSITSKVKRCLLKRKIPTKRMIKISPSKNKCLSQNPGPSAVSKIIDIELCSSAKHTSMQIKDDKSFINTAVGTLQHKVDTTYFSPIKMHNESNIQIKKSIEAQKEDYVLINKVQNLKNINDFVSEDETFYLPAEQAANRNDMDNLNLNDTENKPPEKKKLDKFNVLPKRKIDVSEQLNMRCKADRAKLNGWDCWECREYYKNLSLSKEELQKRRNQCSRHRHKYERPNTPEGFWDPEFPETLSSTYRQNER